LAAPGRKLEYLTVGWNSLEAIIAIAAGLLAGSIALVGFGVDSVIETYSGAILLWRLFSGEHRERLALKLVGGSFIALALYVAFDAVKSLIFREAPEETFVGVALAALSLVVMPLLARAKRRVAVGLNSRALQADSRQTDSRQTSAHTFRRSCWPGLDSTRFSAGGGPIRLPR
jgi:divalent metal cation (Fe/Co/Zn/Cd) transporter